MSESLSTAKLAGRLLAKLAVIAHDVEDVQAVAAVLGQRLTAESVGAVEGRRWLQSLQGALDRLQLECADAQFSARQLRDQVPGGPALQLRLLD